MESNFIEPNKININKINNIVKVIFEKIIPFILVFIYIIRIMCYDSNIETYVGLSSSPLGKIETIFSLISIFLQYVAITLVLISSFIKEKYMDWYVRLFTIPIFIFNLIMLDANMILLVEEENKILRISLIIESILGIIIAIYKIYNYLIDKEKFQIDFKKVIKFISVFLLLLIPALPPYFIQFMFGLGNPTIIVKDISFAHRIFLYIGLMVPVILYFLLRNKDENTIKYVLIYISITTLVGFLINYNYKNIFKPWTWPFHLCNTAMFIIPLCLIFKLKKLFYFTYFINVLGAFLAMVMPNYNDTTNIFSMRIFNFWYNHWIAFFMPLLIVALKVFARPKIKEFVYSMTGFFIYFVIALMMNVVFTSIDKSNPSLNIGSVDYFFINSDFIAEKLGTWAQKLFNLVTIINIGNLEFEFHPIYQLLFFSVYIILGLMMWFIYSEFFILADEHYVLHTRLKEIKIKEKMKKEIFNNNSSVRGDIMTDNIILQLDDFSKIYGTSNRYAVSHASFTVNGGEIFGFLGPNGAGKSTIIKSIVGIQTITSGKINVCGYDVSINPVESKYNIGYVPDHYALYEKLTGREYVNYIADIYDVSDIDRNERIENFIKIFELEKQIDNKIKTYSHGMKQKITIMAALVHEPKVWILDEPLTGLDPNSIYQVKECMKQHAEKGNIVFFSSHLIDIVEKLCDRIAIIKQGKIVCVKTLKEIEEMYDVNGNQLTLEEFYMQTISENSEN